MTIKTTNEREEIAKRARMFRMEDAARQMLKPGDRLRVTRCGGRTVTVTFQGWDGHWIRTATYDDVAPASIVKVNGRPVDFTSDIDTVDSWRASILADIADERLRQESKGYTVGHDIENILRGTLALAAATYALCHDDHEGCGDRLPVSALKLWPFALHAFRPGQRRENLVKAAALLLAEIERVDAEDIPW